jgi:hypothetical protein
VKILNDWWMILCPIYGAIYAAMHGRWMEAFWASVCILMMVALILAEKLVGMQRELIDELQR